MSDARLRAAIAALTLTAPAALTVLATAPAFATAGSATLTNGVLSIKGGDVAIAVTVAPDTTGGLEVTATSGGDPIGEIAGCTWDAATPTVNDCAGVTSLNIVGSNKADSVAVGSAVTQPLTFNGLAGNDTVTGGAGNDNLIGGLGTDTLNGGGGNDALRPNAPTTTLWQDGGDVVNGGGGSDRALYSGYPTSTTYLAVSLDGTANDGVGGENDNIATDVENVTVSGLKSAQVVVVGSAVANSISVSDVKSGVVDGGAGNDTITNTGDTTGTNSTNPDASASTHGGDGNDKITGRGYLYGDAGTDTLTGTAGAENINGGTGADTVNSLGGTDTIDALDDSVDTVNCGDGTDGIRAGSTDTLTDCETVAIPAPSFTTPADGDAVPVSSTGVASITVTNRLPMTSGASVTVKNALSATIGTGSISVGPNGTAIITVQLSAAAAKAVAANPTKYTSAFVFTGNGKTVRVNRSLVFTAS
ncbi:hypothetical protein [Nocardioides jejuensis]|uniref:Calcium-binding protein n=1 Tax=Nocardioides jejuensis TaxID=2502782 RepID=A0A4R1CKV6_9ACTN|nr:hypothetical protein [Nocardioides jejuensis]TCJ30846.1 hypothetical protein EPD65_02070 [Nocardioides jejuensis]